MTQTDVALGQQYWLFSKFDRQYGPPAGDSDYRALRPTEYTPERRDAYSYVKIRGENPPTYVGVIDPGSDDIVIDFY